MDNVKEFFFKVTFEHMGGTEEKEFSAFGTDETDAFPWIQETIELDYFNSKIIDKELLRVE
jgi:hypothetical protein